MEMILDKLFEFGPTISTIIIFVLIYLAIKFILSRQSKGKSDWSMIRSIVLFSIALIGLISVILALPMDESLKGQVTSLMGIVISAALALSSATFIGNGLAGIMLKSIKNFRPGDFIEVQETFGRVSEQGLFHTEIQTANRDLITLPNLYLATNPIRVKRSSGTFISSEVSLGYEVNWKEVETALIKAGENAGLKDSFVQVTALGDFSIVYLLQGLLQDVKTIISARSKLNKCVIDALHDAGIEIVSPNFMNQRQVGETVFIPKKSRKKIVESPDAKPENVIFDKAEEAETLENRKMKIAEVDKKVLDLQAQLKSEADENKKVAIQKNIDSYVALKQKMELRLDDQMKQLDSEA